MTPLRKRMIEDMKLAGLAGRTQECYVDAVAQLARKYGCCPKKIIDEEIREYFVELVEERQVSQSTLRVHRCGIKFLYEKSLHRVVPCFGNLRSKREKKLPTVLSEDEVDLILSKVRQDRARMCLEIIYGCGLRVSEGAHLSVPDIDGPRKLVKICNGKGGVDRFVPITPDLLEDLRDYYRLHKPQHWFFFGRDRETPISISTVQRAFKRALSESGVSKQAHVHTLRHYSDCRIIPHWCSSLRASARTILADAG